MGRVVWRKLWLWEFVGLRSRNRCLKSLLLDSGWFFGLPRLFPDFWFLFNLAKLFCDGQGRVLLDFRWLRDLLFGRLWYYLRIFSSLLSEQFYVQRINDIFIVKLTFVTADLIRLFLWIGHSKLILSLLFALPFHFINLSFLLLFKQNSLRTAKPIDYLPIPLLFLFLNFMNNVLSGYWSLRRNINSWEIAAFLETSQLSIDLLFLHWWVI